MKDIIEQRNSKSQQFRDTLKVSKPEKDETSQIINKKLQNVYARKDAQLAEKKRKIAYLKAMNKVQEQEEKEQR